MKKTSVIEILNNIKQYELENGKTLTNAEKVAIITDTLKKELEPIKKNKRHIQ